jgi:ankyrin repeat protein
MKTKYCALILLLAAAVAHAQTNKLASLLQQGLLDEEANHNLNAAIADYRSLATQFDKDRQVAATAIYRLGECYRMLGRTNEAVSQYERIVREFSDQETLATLSRQDLTGLGRLGISSQAAAASPSPEATRELDLVKKLRRMSIDDVIQIAPTLLTDAPLINLIYQYNQCAIDLLRLRGEYGPQHTKVLSTKEAQKGLSDMIYLRLDGILKALSMEAAPSGNIETAGALDEEDQEIQHLKQLIQNSPDLLNSSSHGMLPPLCRAANAGQLRVAKFLLATGVDVNVNSGLGRPLECAVEAGQNAMVNLLLDHHADVNADSGRPLRSAANSGYLIIAETLLAHGANPNPVESEIDGPLLVAVHGNDTPMVELLLRSGANPNKEGVIDWWGKNAVTPLFVAIEMNELPMLKLLLDSKADSNAQDKVGQMSLHYAAYFSRRNEDIFKLLLDYKANPNLKDKNGRMPFDLAKGNNLPAKILDLLRLNERTLPVTSARPE